VELAARSLGLVPRSAWFVRVAVQKDTSFRASLLLPKKDMPSLRSLSEQPSAEEAHAFFCVRGASLLLPKKDMPSLRSLSEQPSAEKRPVFLLASLARCARLFCSLRSRAASATEGYTFFALAERTTFCGKSNRLFARFARSLRLPQKDTPSLRSLR
jgi:hypothetical protein